LGPRRSVLAWFCASTIYANITKWTRNGLIFLECFPTLPSQQKLALNLMFTALLNAVQTLPDGLNRTRFGGAFPSLERERLHQRLEKRCKSVALCKCGEMDSFGFVLLRREVSNCDRAKAAPSCHRLSNALAIQLGPFRVEMTQYDSPTMHAGTRCPTVAEMRQIGIVLNRFAYAVSDASRCRCC
jgi:hypothetical protein